MRKHIVAFEYRGEAIARLPINLKRAFECGKCAIISALNNGIAAALAKCVATLPVDSATKCHRVLRERGMAALSARLEHPFSQNASVGSKMARAIGGRRYRAEQHRRHAREE